MFNYGVMRQFSDDSRVVALVAPGGSLLKIYGYYVRPESRNHDPLPCHFMLKKRVFFENNISFYRVKFLSGFGGLIKNLQYAFFYDYNIRSIDPIL